MTMFDKNTSVRLNDLNVDRIERLIKYFNDHDEDDFEYTASDIIRIAINRLYRDKLGEKK
jgi:uncharacterized protein with HEPN domain